MPVIILIGNSSIYCDQIVEYFANKYTTMVFKEEYTSIRSSLANQTEDMLYILSNLSKPERYEIFCLTRKNEQQFVTIADKNKTDLVASDKNVLILNEFSGSAIQEEINKSRLAKTSANKRSKGVSLSGLSNLKIMIDRINKEFSIENNNACIVLNNCEERIIKMTSLGITGSPEEIEDCYRKMVISELKNKGFL